jgi:hypothetical protein
MRWLNLIKGAGLILLGVPALVILLPLIILSLEVVLLTGLLILVGALGAKLAPGWHHLHAWWGNRHWALHRHPGPKLRAG